MAHMQCSSKLLPGEAILLLHSKCIGRPKCSFKAVLSLANPPWVGEITSKKITWNFVLSNCILSFVKPARDTCDIAMKYL